MACCVWGSPLEDIINLEPSIFIPGSSGYILEIEVGRRSRGKSLVRSEITILVNKEGVSTYSGKGHTRLDHDDTWTMLNTAVSKVVPDERMAYGLTEGLVACAMKKKANGLFSSPAVSPSNSRASSPVNF